MIDAALLAAEDAKPNTRPYLGASEIGDDCARAVQYGYIRSQELPHAPKPEPFPARLLRIFAMGHSLEDYVASLIRLVGFELQTVKKDGIGQIGWKVMGERYRGHVDGVIHGGPLPMSYPIIWENKSMNAKYFAKTKDQGVQLANKRYAAQISQNAAYLEIQGGTLFSAICKNTAELHWELVPFDGALAQQMSDRAVEIIKATDAGRLMPRIAASQDHFACRWCRWRESCWPQSP